MSKSCDRTGDGAGGGAAGRRAVRGLAACAGAAAVLAGIAGAAPSAGPSRVLQLDASGLGADIESAVLVVEGGTPFGCALLVVEGESGAASAVIRFDAEGRYSRRATATQLDGVRGVHARFAAGDAASGALRWSEIRRHYRPPHASSLPKSGEVVISEVMKDPTFVSDASGEWFEVVNTGSGPVDLEGWTIADLGSDSHVISTGGAGLWIGAGQRLVLGIQDDYNLNGGVLVDYRYAGFTLSNGADEVVLRDASGALVDAIAFDGGTLWPDTPGAALSLTPAATDALSNDDPQNWCDAQSQVNPVNPDLGTPGLQNDVCP